MSSMDSGINSIATVIISDFVKSAKNEVRLARILTVVLGVSATALAFYVSTLGGIIKAFASFMSLFSAPVLALFLLGILTRRGNFKGWLVGLCVSVPATLWLQKVVEAHWVYFFPFSFLVAFLVALFASRLFKPTPA
jgi:Na+/proline symporter